MPKFLEAKLKKQYGADSDVPYKIMNKIGAMHGNKETPKGAAMEAKHAATKVAEDPLTRRKRKQRASAEKTVRSTKLPPNFTRGK